MLTRTLMHEAAARPDDGLVSLGDDRTLEREFDECVRESGTLALRVAYAVLRNRADAEDVAQEALARCYERFATLRDRGRFRPWLARVAWRIALDHRRGSQRRERREQAATTSVILDGEELAAANEFQRRLWHAIDELPEKLRLVVVLAAIEGHDGQAVARLLGLPLGTVKSRLHLARRHLAERLR